MRRAPGGACGASETSPVRRRARPRSWGRGEFRVSAKTLANRSTALRMGPRRSRGGRRRAPSRARGGAGNRPPPPGTDGVRSAGSPPALFGAAQVMRLASLRTSSGGPWPGSPGRGRARERALARTRGRAGGSAQRWVRGRGPGTRARVGSWASRWESARAVRRPPMLLPRAADRARGWCCWLACWLALSSGGAVVWCCRAAPF